MNDFRKQPRQQEGHKLVEEQDEKGQIVWIMGRKSWETHTAALPGGFFAQVSWDNCVQKAEQDKGQGHRTRQHC